MHLNVYYFQSGLNKNMMTYLTLKQHGLTVAQLWAIQAPAFGMEASTPSSIRNYDRVDGIS